MRLEWDLAQIDLPKLKKENRLLKEQLEASVNEVECVRWYTEVLEAGIDTG